jgi:hypothetical protein
MANKDAESEKEHAKRLWEQDRQAPPPDDDWPEPVGGFFQGFKMPSDEEREAFNEWMAEAYSAAYDGYSEGQLRLEFQFEFLATAKDTAMRHRDDLCRLYARVRPVTDRDYVTLTVMVVDFLFSVGLQTPFSIGSIAFFVVRRGILDQICPKARRATG